MEKIIVCVCVCVCVCVNSTFGRCCPCEKKDGGKEIIDKDKNSIHTDKVKNKLNDNVVDYKYFSDPKNEEEKLINEIIEEALKNDVICDECKNTKDSKSKIRLVFDDPVARASKNPSIKKVEHEFGFCEKHKTCSGYCCNKNAKYLFQCGHRLCLDHYQKSTNEIVCFCPDCNILMCNLFNREVFGTHLLCDDTSQERHYFCYKGNDSENPYKKKGTKYKSKEWICPKCKNKK